jgi:hypothetical protein
MHRIYRLLERVDEPGLFGELESAIGDLVCETERNAARQQGRVIMAAICGDLVAWPGGDPRWQDRPDDA